MNAALLAVAGPLAGQAFALTASEITIGRASSNLVRLPFATVSRYHCVIEESGGRIQLRDLDSHNGTYVNGSPVKLCPLDDGDRLDVGEVSLVFTAGGVGANSGSPLTGSCSALTTAARSPDDAPALPRETAALFRISALAHCAHDLYISRDTSSRPQLDKLFRELVYELLPMGDAGIVLLDPAGQPDLLAGSGPKASAAGLDRAKVDAVVAARAPTCTAVNGVHFLAAPLLALDDVLGVFYVSRRLPFAETDSQTLAAITEILAREIHHARDLNLLVAENRLLRSEVNVERNMVGESDAMQALYRAIAKLAPGNSTVLIRGESGTGKELVARAIHRNSPRSAKPFVAINCAAVTETLLESELFGHEKGAFTGAVAQRKGKLETADTGTLFLDEVGELAPALQAKLLRVLQEREFERVGGNRTIPVDVRVLAATNRDLEEALRAGAFRQDLYYRLNVIAITVPPLRDRRDDIPLLANWFAQKVGAEVGRQITGISRAARAMLLDYDWPGNIRELRNAIERAVVLGSSPSILPEDLPEVLLDAPPPQPREPGGFHDAVREAKKRIILEAVEQARGNVSEAARTLGLHPNYLHRLVTTLHLRDRIPGS